MAVDSQGYITQPTRNKIQPAFSGVAADLVRRLPCCFPEQIHSLYLYGSVAEGRATVGRSDLDVSLIFHGEPDEQTAQHLARIKSELEIDHPVVSKIDFDCGLLQQALHPDNRLSWGYWLRHHCVCVYGEDLSQRFRAFTPSKAIALALNSDFPTVVAELMAQRQASGDENRKLLLQRAVARKLIRATSILRDEQDTDWPETLTEHSDKFILRYPALAGEMNYLMKMAHQPYDEETTFEKRVMAFAGWLNVAFRNQQH